MEWYVRTEVTATPRAAVLREVRRTECILSVAFVFSFFLGLKREGRKRRREKKRGERKRQEWCFRRVTINSTMMSYQRERTMGKEGEEEGGTWICLGGCKLPANNEARPAGPAASTPPGSEHLAAPRFFSRNRVTFHRFLTRSCSVLPAKP